VKLVLIGKARTRWVRVVQVQDHLITTRRSPLDILHKLYIRHNDRISKIKKKHQTSGKTPQRLEP